MKYDDINMKYDDINMKYDDIDMKYDDSNEINDTFTSFLLIRQN